MRTAREIMEEAKRTGRVWVCGEMDLPARAGYTEARQKAYMIGDACGYFVTGKAGILEIEGGDITGRLFLRYGPDHLRSVHVWTEEVARWNDGA